MIHDHILTFDYIKDKAQKIHYFGLGFIQVKLNEYERLHFYTNELEKTIGVEEIHNHRYNFTSHILQGHLKQDIYEVSHIDLLHRSNHILTQESCNETNPTNSKPTEVWIKPVFQKIYEKGDSYYMDHNTFHTVDSIDAVTYLNRSGYTKILADVIRKKDSKLICPFSVKVTEHTLLEIIRERFK